MPADYSTPMSKFQLEFFLPLHPRVLKNSKRLVRLGKTGRTIALPSKAVKAFMDAATKLLNGKGPPSPCEGLVRVQMVFFGPWTESDGPDLSNLYQAVEDVLQIPSVGVLRDDFQVASHDGSRRVSLCPHCPRRKPITRGARKGQYQESCGKKASCPYMGIRILVTEFDSSETHQLARDRIALHDGSADVIL